MKQRLSFHALEILYASITEFRSTEETAWIAKFLAFHNQLDRNVVERNAEFFIDVRLCDNAFVVTYDFKMLERVFNRVVEERKERVLHEEFIRRGASSTCMLELFGLKKHQVNSLRKFIGEVGEDTIKIGRPNLDRIDEVVDAYLEVSKQNPELTLPEKILELQLILGLPIATLWNLLQQACPTVDSQSKADKNLVELR